MKSVRLRASKPHSRPVLAKALAQGISDRPLRTNTLRNLALQCAERDAVSAVRYVGSSGAFSPSKQEGLLADIRAQPGT